MFINDYRYDDWKNILDNNNIITDSSHYTNIKCTTTSICSSPSDVTPLFNNNITFSNDDAFLDIGCGIGLITLFVNKKYNNCHCIGIDINQNVLNIAIKNAKILNAKNVYFFNENATTFEIPLNVTCIFIFNPLNDDQVALSMLFDRIHESFNKLCRIITIIYVNPLVNAFTMMSYHCYIVDSGFTNINNMPYLIGIFNSFFMNYLSNKIAYKKIHQ